jgi:hypothetical protein
MANARDILARRWKNTATFDVDENFDCGPPRPISAETVVKGWGWTLFSFDFVRSQAVFLLVSESADLTRAAFAYNAQFEKATEIALLDFDELLALTEAMADVPRLVQFFSIGHCGSTLLHHVFNRVPGVWCISEPVAFLNLAMNGSTVNADVQLKLARAALRLLLSFPGAAQADCVVVKHFSQSTTQLALLHEAQPKGLGLFLYRDALGWSNSHFHFVQKHGVGMDIAPDMRSFLWRIMSGGKPEDFLSGILDLQADQVTFDEMSAIAWWLHMLEYAEARRVDVPLLPLRYNELAKSPAETLAQLFVRLGFPLDSIAGTLTVFDTHSHAGTKTARSADDVDFTPENYERVRRILSRDAINTHPDLLLEA